MIASNLALITEHRTYNVEALADFEAYLAGLDDAAKAIPEYDFSTLRAT
jgi:hypothetical protein